MQGQVEEVSMEGCRRDDEVFVFVCGCEDDEGAESEGCEGGQEFCEEGYVVMKSETEVVEEMMRSKAIMLVDELFLECKPQQGNRKRKNGRAYWECLALYGKLRDEGVAVHQWWG